MKSEYPGSRKGRRNVRPSKAAVANYYRLLQDKAEEGDTAAAGWLLLLSEKRDTKAENA